LDADINALGLAIPLSLKAICNINTVENIMGVEAFSRLTKPERAKASKQYIIEKRIPASASDQVEAEDTPDTENDRDQNLHSSALAAAEKMELSELKQLQLDLLPFDLTVKEFHGPSAERMKVLEKGSRLCACDLRVGSLAYVSQAGS